MSNKLFVQLSRPSESYPAGVVAEAEYEVAGGRVSLTKYNGEALSADRRKRYSHKLKKGDEPRVIASRLAKDYAFSLNNNKPFSRTLNYPKIGIA